MTYMPRTQNSGLDLEGRLMTRMNEHNQKDGLLLCGINWGTNAKDSLAIGQGIILPKQPRSYFSDPDCNNTKFAQRIRDWFDLFGHPLRQTQPTTFEWSISQMNWLDSQTPHADGLGPKQFVQYRHEFLPYLASLKPRLLIFFSVSLLTALNDPLCMPTVETALGKRSGKPDIKMRGGKQDGLSSKRWRVGIQYFERSVVIGLPHPLPRGPHPRDDFINLIAPDIKPFIANYKRGL